LAVILYIIARCFRRDAQNTVIISVIFGLADILTDVVFASALIAKEGWTLMATCAIIFIGVPVLVNIGVAIYMMRRFAQDDPAYLQNNYILVAAVTVMAGV